MSIAYVFTKYELSLLMSQLNIEPTRFPQLCKPIDSSQQREVSIKSLYDKGFISIDGSTAYVDKVIKFIVQQLGTSKRCIKIHDHARVYICKNVLVATETNAYNPNIVKVIPLKDVKMLNEHFNINLKEG